MMKVSVVIERAAETFGESPHWLTDTQSLLFVDCLVGGLRIWDSKTGTINRADVEGVVGFAAPCDVANQYIIGQNQSIRSFNWSTGELATLAAVDDGLPTRINDGKADVKGRLWAGTMGLFSASPLEDPVSKRSHGSFYSLDANGTTISHVRKLNISNGLDWSTDNRIMFHIDSVPGILTAYDFNVQDGTISNPRIVLDRKAEDIAAMGRPDGMTVDQEDKLWVACITAGKVIRLDPETGQVIRTVLVPAKKPTSCCFGGADLDELYVTSARSGLSEAELVSSPLSGSVFRITGLGVKGKPTFHYSG